MGRGKKKRLPAARTAGAWLPYDLRKAGIRLRFEDLSTARYSEYRLVIDALEVVILSHRYGPLPTSKGQARQTERVINDWSAGWGRLLLACQHRIKAGFVLVEANPPKVLQWLSVDLACL